jgi:hypothetical protein
VAARVGVGNPRAAAGAADTASRAAADPATAALHTSGLDVAADAEGHVLPPSSAPRGLALPSSTTDARGPPPLMVLSPLAEDSAVASLLLKYE